MSTEVSRIRRYSLFLLFIAGLGGLLYGIDVGIIAAALLYVNKTISLTVEQESIIVAAVLGGGMVSSLIAGALADLFGRKILMIASGLMFVISVGIIVSAHGFVTLFLGRLLQGMSGGVIAVVVPLYLAECLPPENRGRGTAIFQFMLTFGIVCASLVGWFYTGQAESATVAAAGNAGLILAVQNHAWRAMFLSVIYPGIIFFLGAFALSESPRWLLRRGQTAEALKALLRSVPEQEAHEELSQMQSLLRQSQSRSASGSRDSLLRRKYVVPFVIACVIMVCNQTTGINSILGFLVVVLKQAGMTASHATQGDAVVKGLNCLMTLVAVMLVERKGRRFLLRIGTGGVIVALVVTGSIFLVIESRSINVKPQIVAAQSSNGLDVPLTQLSQIRSFEGTTSLTVLYSYRSGDHIATVLSTDPDPVLRIHPDAGVTASPLIIERAMYGPVPGERTGWLVTACLALFIAAYAVGPGVVVWLAASELMPTRIRSLGLGFSLVLNQGMSTLIAAAFLPVVGRFGYPAMFFPFAACTVIYFVTAVFYLPETKGKSLEEIEMYFDRGKSLASPAADAR